MDPTPKRGVIKGNKAKRESIVVLGPPERPTTQTVHTLAKGTTQVAPGGPNVYMVGAIWAQLPEYPKREGRAGRSCYFIKICIWT